MVLFSRATWLYVEVHQLAICSTVARKGKTEYLMDGTPHVSAIGLTAYWCAPPHQHVTAIGRPAEHVELIGNDDQA